MPVLSPTSSGTADVGRSGKSGKPGPGKIVVLTLSPDVLAIFASKPASRKGGARSKSSTTSSSTPVPAVKEESLDNGSESNSTPAPGSTPSGATSAPGEPPKKKGVPGPKPGSKRGIALVADGIPKPKGKPGPKKKPRLDDGTVDHGDGGAANKGAAGAAGPLANHKLGPKANQGAINAGLRALDRSGKPCRRWEKKGFQIKSFTGVIWKMPTWRAPRPSAVDDKADSKADGSTALATDSDGKENKGSSAVDSEKSNNAGDGDMAAAPSNGASSPAPVVATPA